MSLNGGLFPLLNASTPVKALLGSNPLRVYPWGEAPQNPTKPYAVYSVYSGIPENYLGNVPDIDNHGTQIDIYANTGVSCSACYVAIRDAIEGTNHVTSFQTPTLDPDTKLYIARIETDIWQSR